MLLHESLQPQGSEGKAIGRLDLGNGAVQAEAETAQQVVGQFPDFPFQGRAASPAAFVSTNPANNRRAPRD